MHTYIHTYMHSCIHTYIHAYIHTFMHTYLHTYVYRPVVCADPAAPAPKWLLKPWWGFGAADKGVSESSSNTPSDAYDI